MIPDKICLSRAGLKLTLARPGTFYRGTRFDWSGVFIDVVKDDDVYCDSWFDTPDPLRHDNVCGPSEEFYGCYGYDSAGLGDGFLKLGVGILRRDSDAPYDWFHTYGILDPGRRSLELTPNSAMFTHEIEDVYNYVKTIELTGFDSFRISHTLTTSRSMRIRQYCHNFFTFGKDGVGVERSVEFDAPITGKWREDSVNVENDTRRIWITAPMQPGQKCYLDDIRSSMPDGYAFTLKAGCRSVRAVCSLPMAPSVLWSNHRVFCPEPFIELDTVSGKSIEWSIDYKLL